MKKSIFTLSVISVLFSSQAFAQISLNNDGYSFSGCSDQGSYNLCSFSGSSTGSSNSIGSTIGGNTVVHGEGSVTVNSSTPGFIKRPQLVDSSSNSSTYMSSNAANNIEYSTASYNYNTYYNGRRFYKVVSCDVDNTTYYGSSKNSGFGNSGSSNTMVNPQNRSGSKTAQYKEDNGWASVEFFDPTTQKSLGWGGALIAKQEVWFNNKLDHYEGDSISGTKYAIGQPNDGWNVVHQEGQCQYPFDPIFISNGGGGGN